MSIPLTSNFSEQAPLPLDSRETCADLTARDAIATGVRYEGLTVYVTAEEKTYQLVGGTENSDWVEFGAGGTETDPLSLHLDQTTPQTITGGKPNFSAGMTAYTQISGTTDEVFDYANYNSSSAYNGATISLGRARGTILSPTIVSNGDYIGSIRAMVYDGVAFKRGGELSFYVDGVPGADDTPTGMKVLLAPDGSATRAEVFNLSNAGILKLAKYTTAGLLNVSATGVVGTDTNAYLTDAAGSIANDHKQYARKDNAWAEVVIPAGMVYPGAGIAKSTGTAWDTSISGTSAQFVKGDGSLDSSTYITSSALTPYALLDGTNQPFTGNLNVSKPNTITGSTDAIQLKIIGRFYQI
jgi:hypothetical protein